MYIKVGNRIINAAQIAEVEIRQAHETYWDGGEEFPAMPLRVYITTTAIIEVALQESFGSEHCVGASKAHQIRLDGEEAELFLAALPVYELVREET